MINWKVAKIQNRKLHFKNATMQLDKLIKEGKVDKSIFSAEQLKDIYSHSVTISGFTWHHHENFGRMQLVPRYLHSKTGHMGGFKLWFR